MESGNLVRKAESASFRIFLVCLWSGKQCFLMSIHGLFQILLSKIGIFINKLRNLYSDFGLKTLKFLDDSPNFS